MLSNLRRIDEKFLMGLMRMFLQIDVLGDEQWDWHFLDHLFLYVDGHLPHKHRCAWLSHVTVNIFRFVVLIPVSVVHFF